MEPTTPFRIDGKVALITGGASGIGECTSRAFSLAGASVIVADIDSKKAEALAAELPGSRAMHCDIVVRVAEDRVGAVGGNVRDASASLYGDRVAEHEQHLRCMPPLGRGR